MSLVDDVITQLGIWAITPALVVKDRNQKIETTVKPNCIAVSINPFAQPERLMKRATIGNKHYIESRRIYLFFSCESSTVLDSWMTEAKRLMVAKTIQGGWWEFVGETGPIHTSSSKTAIQEYLETKFV